MTQYLIMCRSVTHAQRAARLLERNGISAAVTKAPQRLSEKGCSYAVILRRRLPEALELMRGAKLLTGRIYEIIGKDEYREVRP